MSFGLTPEQDLLRINPRESLPFFRKDARLPSCVQFSMGENWGWSGAIDLNQMGTAVLAIASASEDAQKQHKTMFFLATEMKPERESVRILVSSATHQMIPISVVNKTNKSVEIGQRRRPPRLYKPVKTRTNVREQKQVDVGRDADVHRALKAGQVAFQHGQSDQVIWCPLRSWIVPPLSSFPFSWDDLTLSSKAMRSKEQNTEESLVLSIMLQHRNGRATVAHFQPDNVGVQGSMPFAWHCQSCSGVTSTESRTCSTCKSERLPGFKVTVFHVHVELDRGKKLVIIEEHFVGTSMNGPKTRIDLNAKSTTESGTPKSEHMMSATGQKLTLDLAQVGLVFIDSQGLSLCCAHVQHLDFVTSRSMTPTNVQSRVELNVSRMQISVVGPSPKDVLIPVILSTPVATKAQPNFLSAAVVISGQDSQSLGKLSTVDLLLLRLRQFRLDFDEEFLRSAFAFASEILRQTRATKEGMHTTQYDIISQRDLSSYLLQDSEQGLLAVMRPTVRKQVLISNCFISPIEFKLSYLTHKDARPFALRQTDAYKMWRKKRGLNMLVSFKHAPFRLQGLLLKNTLVTQQSFLLKLSVFYSQQLAKHTSKVIGSSTWIGSPVNVWGNMTQGIHQIVDGNPSGALNGIGRVGLSAIHGVSSLTSGLLGGVGKGISSLSADRHYMRKRENSMQRNAPENVFEGVGKGAKSLLRGFADGVSGIVTQPIKGAKKSGVKGMFKGVGKGVLGFVVKPVTGTLDAVASVSRGVQATTSSDKSWVEVSLLQEARLEGEARRNRVTKSGKAFNK